jgi:hypothetical protein
MTHNYVNDIRELSLSMNANACEDSVLQDIHEAIDKLDEAQKRTVQDYLCLSSELQLEAGMHGSDEV